MIDAISHFEILNKNILLLQISSYMMFVIARQIWISVFKIEIEAVIESSMKLKEILMYIATLEDIPESPRNQARPS